MGIQWCMDSLSCCAPKGLRVDEFNSGPRPYPREYFRNFTRRDPRGSTPPHRRVRAGQFYHVTDAASPLGWSVVEIEEEAPKNRAAFVLGQLEAVPLAELRGRILGPVPAPAE